MPRISACVIVYHEEAVIERCLASLCGAADEIIIVHDGPCNDRTLEIASQFTDKIYIRDRYGEAEPHRVFAVEQATGEWVLWYDADEYFSPELADALPSLAESTTVDAYESLWPLWDGVKEITQGWPWRGFMFRKSALTYLGFPHEHFHTTGITERIPLILHHHPKYNNFTWKAFTGKWRTWAKLQATAYLVPFSQHPKYNLPASDWSLRMKIAIAFSFLFPLHGAYGMVMHLRGGSWREGFIGWKAAILWGAYVSMVYAYVTKYRLFQPAR